MSRFILTEYRLKPMFREDFSVAWRKLYNQLKSDGHVVQTNLFQDDESKFYSIVEWSSDYTLLNDPTYSKEYARMLEILDKMQVLAPLTKVE